MRYPYVTAEHIAAFRKIALETGVITYVDMARILGCDALTVEKMWNGADSSNRHYRLKRFRKEAELIEAEANLAARKRLEIAKPRREPQNTGVNYKPKGSIARDGTHRPPGRPPKRPHELAPAPSRPSTVPIAFAKPAAAATPAEDTDLDIT